MATESYTIWFRHSGQNPIDINSSLWSKERVKSYTRSEIIAEVGDNVITHLNVGRALTPSLLDLAPEVLGLSIRDPHNLECVSKIKFLTTLNISENRTLKEIPNLPTSLKELDASQCDLLTLPPNMAQLTNLKTLNMHQNNSLEDISSLPTSLEYIDMKFCAISALPQSMLHMENLWYLDASNNKNISSDGISHLPTSLIELNLCDCGMSTILPRMSLMTKLKKLDISCNDSLEVIENLPPFLEELIARFCSGLTAISPSTSQLTKLWKIDMARCGSLREFDNLPRSLDCLILAFSGLHTLPSSLSQLTNLTELDLEYSYSLKEIGDLPTSLERLILNHCSLTDLPPSIAKLQNLRELDISSNYFTRLPSCVTELKSLETLDLIYDVDCSPPLISLDEGIVSMPNLVYVHVAGCENLTTPPYDVCEDGVEAIKAYYENIAAGSMDSGKYETAE